MLSSLRNSTFLSSVTVFTVRFTWKIADLDFLFLDRC